MSKPPKPPSSTSRPLTEGYVEKGGVNSSGSFDRRPPPPAAMKPSSSKTPPPAKKS